MGGFWTPDDHLTPTYELTTTNAYANHKIHQVSCYSHAQFTRIKLILVNMNKGNVT